ncbi:MAG TPA: carboxypeptidase regulatory-like domain-containing protein [Gemmatimonadales bacterium]|nr:carboxypeptidase regulatory-like domain-containing protein [Gemmatimonadales bacterium]
MKPRSARVAAGSFLAFTTALGAQATVSAPGGVLRGTVQDSLTGEPVGYALVILVEPDRRVFASAAGAFFFPDLGPGPLTLRVQQIGYRGVSVPLQVDTRSADPGSQRLLIRLSHHALVLPEVAVEAQECPAGPEPGDLETGTILDEVFKNGERLLTLQQEYPYRASMQHVTAVLNAERATLRRTVDTVHFEKSRQSAGYQRGKVLGMSRFTEFGRPAFREYAVYFEAADLARPEFRRNHCFWLAGPDSVRGFPAYRIEFRPLAKVTTADWAGALQIDSASMHLLRSEAYLVNLPATGSSFRAAQCSALYTQLVPTLVHEFQAHCVTAQNVRPPAFTDERWTLLNRAFLGRRPDQPDPP